MFSLTFFYFAMVLRFLQGLGDALVSTAGYSIITIENPPKKDSYIGYCQSAIGIGLMLGPIIGQSLYVVLNFEMTFYTFGVVFALSMGVLMIVIPNHINHADDIPS